MPETREQSERIQFPLRAMFVLTLCVALLATCVRWAIDLEAPIPKLGSAAIGVFVGAATLLILQHVRLDCLLVALLIAFVIVNGFWFTGRVTYYLAGLLIGATIAWQGLHVVNLLLQVCGVTISKPGKPPHASRED